MHDPSGSPFLAGPPPEGHGLPADRVGHRKSRTPRQRWATMLAAAAVVLAAAIIVVAITSAA